MTTTIINDWITLSVLRNGVTVQRKFAGLDTFINEDNTVKYCTLKYWERELYPTGIVIKTQLKSYVLEDLAYTEITVGGIVYSMQPLPVLSNFITSLGIPSIINPSRVTLTDVVKLPVTVEDGYPVNRDTRPRTVKV